MLVEERIWKCLISAPDRNNSRGMVLLVRGTLGLQLCSTCDIKQHRYCIAGQVGMFHPGEWGCHDVLGLWLVIAHHRRDTYLARFDDTRHNGQSAATANGTQRDRAPRA